ncbi:MAG: DUF4115 domain-containing protein [Sedimenticola sp.]|nr:DUF4115 domain-containing protein [Sedimenticola sp.]
MNAAETNQEEPLPIIEGPGKQLRDIRMAKELDINRVAGLLHLKISSLKALEADDFSELPGTVFVQGYLKNYARLLDTPVEPILEAFRHFRPAGEEKMDLKAAQVKHEVRSSHAVVRIFTWLIVIGIIALVVTWWRGYLQWPIELGLELNSATGEHQVDEVVQDDVQQRQLNGSMPLPALLGKPEILDAPLTESAESTESSSIAADADEVVVPEKQAVAEGAQIEEAAQTATTERVEEAVSVSASETAEVSDAESSEVSSTEPEPIATAKVEVRFSDACWADIRDASGVFKLAGNQSAGESYPLGGEPPYKMVFGNAAAVTLMVNGKVYDLAPYTRGNVARLTLNP